MKTRIYHEACDASAAVRIGESELFAAASDEDCILRVYHRGRPGAPVARLDVTDFLEPERPDETEADIEGAAQIGDRIYWIGSHGRNSKGKKRKTRQRLFATTVSLGGDGVEFKTTGVPYKRLLKELTADDSLRAFDLEEASTRAPEDKGGLNIEGLAATSRGRLLIGFRNPIPDGHALVVKLKNPDALVEDQAAKARLSVAGRLDLGGRGIRAIEFVRSRGVYLIVAGSFDDHRDFRLYRWSGRSDDAATPIDAAGLSDANPEELVVFGDAAGRLEVDVLSDDGGASMGGGTCKEAPAAKRRFRSITLALTL